MILGRCIEGVFGVHPARQWRQPDHGGIERPRTAASRLLLGLGLGCGAAGGTVDRRCAGELVGWQALFWISGGIAVCLLPVTLRSVAESSDPTRSRSIDWLGTALIALTLAPFILGISKGADWGWTSISTIASFGARSQR